MVEADRDAFFDLVAGVYSFYRQRVSEQTLAIWWQSMLQFELPSVRDAFGRHSMNPDTGQFLPKPADVVKMLAGNTQDSALVAWSKFETAVRSCGSWYSVVFDDPIIHRVVDEMGGWLVLCMTSNKDWPFRQNEFVARYRAYKARGEVPAHSGRMIGTIEGENRSRGYQTPDRECLRMIGDPRLALQVMRTGTALPLLQVTAGAAAERVVAQLESKP